MLQSNHIFDYPNFDSLLLTSRTSLCNLVFISSDFIKSFLAVSRSSSSSVTLLDKAVRRSFICVCSLFCLSMTSWSSNTLARFSSWHKEPSEDRYKTGKDVFACYIEMWKKHLLPTCKHSPPRLNFCWINCKTWNCNWYF